MGRGYPCSSLGQMWGVGEGGWGWRGVGVYPCHGPDCGGRRGGQRDGGKSITFPYPSVRAVSKGNSLVN